jgi:pimeloyl-ACP methyl ester carboxylesterase
VAGGKERKRAARKAEPPPRAARTASSRAAPPAAREPLHLPGTPLTVRGVGMVAGGLALGLGVGIAIERALVGRDRRRDDPEADEPFGRLRGEATTLASHDGTKLHVEELGAGPCLVFSHGFSLTQDAWHYQRRDLPAGFRCVFFDQRGHGRSGPGAGDDYSLGALARDLRAVLDWTGERRVVVVAHSMAGIASLELCRLFPEEAGGRIAGLVLVGSTYADALKGMSAAIAARGAHTVQRALITAAFDFIRHDPVRANRLRRRGSDLGYLGTRLFGFGSSPSPGQVAFVDRLLAETDVEVWAKVFPSLIDFDLSETLAQLDLPVLIAVGDKDRLTPPASARHMADTIPGARLLVLEDAGHSAFLEEHEVLDAAIADFARGALAARRRRAGGFGPRRRRRAE